MKANLIKNTGSILAILSILFTFGLDIYILTMFIESNLDQVNPLVALITGYQNARASQIISFYFQDSKVNADKQRVDI